MHAGTGPLLLTLGIGKLAMVLGGSGQGQPTAGEPATAYLGAGPWGSLAPTLPSIPSQAIEGVATLALLAVVLVVMLAPPFRRPDGRSFVLALGAWSLIRLAVATTWRDRVALGALRAEQAIDVVVAIGCVLVLVVLVVRRRRTGPSSVDRATAAV